MRVSLIRRVPLNKRGIFWTATIIRPDGTDTSPDGDGTLPGHGATREIGWINPGWSMTRLHSSAQDAGAERWEPADGDARGWLAERLERTLAYVTPESLTTDGTGEVSAIYDGATTLEDCYTGLEVTLTAHPYGFTADECRNALERIADLNRARNRATAHLFATSS